jgi:hypothetical protein
MFVHSFNVKRAAITVAAVASIACATLPGGVLAASVTNSTDQEISQTGVALNRGSVVQVATNTNMTFASAGRHGMIANNTFQGAAQLAAAQRGSVVQLASNRNKSILLAH